MHQSRGRSLLYIVKYCIVYKENELKGAVIYSINKFSISFLRFCIYIIRDKYVKHSYLEIRKEYDNLSKFPKTYNQLLLFL